MGKANQVECKINFDMKLKACILGMQTSYETYKTAEKKIIDCKCVSDNGSILTDFNALQDAKHLSKQALASFEYYKALFYTTKVEMATLVTKNI